MTKGANGRHERALVWLHASDPGQAPVLDVLAEQIADAADAPRTLTTGSAPDPGPAPDDAAAVDAFIDAHDPALLVIAGRVLPVPLIDRARARGIPLFLIDAQHPVLPGRRRLVPGQTRAVLSRFEQIHTRNAQSAAVLGRLVKSRTKVLETGALAQFAPAPGCVASELDALRQSLGARPVWFAYDLPIEEADAALLAHTHALRRAHRLLMILQPRDPLIGEALAERARALGFVCALRSRDDEIDVSTQVYIADSEDDAGLFLRLAPVSFLGGSLTPEVGLPSAVTAAALGSALIFGPEADARQAGFLTRLRQAGGGVQIGLAPVLGEALATLLSPEAGADAALKAWVLATEGSEATHRVTVAILDWLQMNRGRE